RSSARSATRRTRVAGGMTPARSVTKPSGGGMRGSAATAGSASARRPSARALTLADGVRGARRMPRGGLSGARVSARALDGPPEPLDARTLRTERIDRLHDALDLAQVGGELAAQGSGRKARLTGPMQEQIEDGGQGARDALAGGEHGGVAVPTIRVPEAEQMAQHHEEALRGLDHELLDG